MHQAQPKEGHKIWLTQEADAKSWSSLKHVQPKEGRKELAPREIKFRYRRLDTAIRERAGSSQVPREAQESERYPGLFFFVSFFSLFVIRDVVGESSRHGRGESLTWCKTERASPTNSATLRRARQGAAKALFVFCLLYTPQNTANLSYEERSLLFKLFRFFTSSYLASAKVISFTSTASLPST